MWTNKFAQLRKQLQKLLRPTRNYRRNHQTYQQIDILDTETFNEELEKVSWQQSKSRENSFGNLKVYQRKRDTDPVLFKKTIRTHQANHCRYAS